MKQTALKLTCLLFAMFCRTAHAGNNPLEGDWMGTLDVQSTQLRLVFHVTESADHKLSGTLDSPDQGAKGIEMTVSSTGGSVVFNVPVVQGSFTGKSEADGKALSGTWKQGPANLPLRLERASAADLAASSRKANPESVDVNKKTGGKLVGHWEGALEAGSKLRVALKINKTAEGGLLASLDSVDQKAFDIPVTQIRMDGAIVHFEMKAIGGDFAAELKGDQLKGTWKQAGAQMPLVLLLKK